MGISIYDLPDWWIDSRKIDWDLATCLYHNDVDFPTAKDLRLTIMDIVKVRAVWVGENDGDNWRWIIQVDKASPLYALTRYVLLVGGCDYTGWDCQSWAGAKVAKSPIDAAKQALDDPYGDKRKDVVDSLLLQLKEGKRKTWREENDKKFRLK